jgi:hypothetical protein
MNSDKSPKHGSSFQIRNLLYPRLGVNQETQFNVKRYN